MSHNSEQQPHDPSNDYLTPKGGKAKRCQAIRKRSKEQCKNPARKGFNVCKTHGAGSRKREATGERAPVGAPVKHGLYSKRKLPTILEMAEQLKNKQQDLRDATEELLILKAIVRNYLATEEQVLMLNETAKESLDRGALKDPEDIHAIQSLIKNRTEYFTTAARLTGMVIDGTAKYHAALDKSLQNRTWDEITRYLHQMRDIMIQYVGYDTYRSIYEEVNVQILSKVGRPIKVE